VTTNYLPPNPPTLADDDEGCSMMLVGQQIRLYFYGRCCGYLDEDAMEWRDLDSILETDELP
jgi:hypothetical protein